MGTDSERDAQARLASTGARTSRERRRVVHEDRAEVGAAGPDVGVAEARARFGGIDVPATLVGMLTALALVALLGGLIGAAIGAIGYQTGLEGIEDDLSIAGLVGGAITLFVSFVVGGWAAARIARYDGPRNGVMTGIWTLILAAAVSALAAWLGDKYDVLSRVDLPQWFSRDAVTAAGIASAAVAVVAMLVGGALGGAWGERYHRRADATIAATRPGGIAGAERQTVRT